MKKMYTALAAAIMLLSMLIGVVDASATSSYTYQPSDVYPYCQGSATHGLVWNQGPATIHCWSTKTAMRNEISGYKIVEQMYQLQDGGGWELDWHDSTKGAGCSSAGYSESDMPAGWDNRISSASDTNCWASGQGYMTVYLYRYTDFGGTKYHCASACSSVIDQGGTMDNATSSWAEAYPNIVH